MPRMARVIVPHTPHHIIQRGHNRNVVFAHAADYHFYLDSLRGLKVEFEVRRKNKSVPFLCLCKPKIMATTLRLAE